MLRFARILSRMSALLFALVYSLGLVTSTSYGQSTGSARTSEKKHNCPTYILIIMQMTLGTGTSEHTAMDDGPNTQY